MTFVRRLTRIMLAAPAALLLALVLVIADPEPPTAGAPPLERAAAPTVRSPAPTEVLVRFTRGASAQERGSARRAADVSLERSLPLSRLQLVRPQPGVSVAEAVERLERSPAVQYAEPDVARSASAMPDDSLLGFQWGLHNVGQSVAGTAGKVDADIDAPEAWDLTPGAAGITVAIVDSGVDAAHPDLAPNLWTNPGESGNGRETNGLDDDQDGFVDDVHGWDFVDGDRVPGDGNGHGTHVAGTVGARGNDGRGVAGVAWRVGLLPLRVLGDDGGGRVSDVVAAYALAARLGIRIVNASLGGSAFSRSERDAIREAPQTLFVVAAGNEAADNDTTPSYPCNHDLANVICVAAIDQEGQLASFSNRGALTVDVAAPGVNIASTYPNGRWVLLDGTSMATPHVAGAAALVWARRPEASVADVRTAILETTEPHPSLTSLTVTGGSLNLQRAVSSIAPVDAPAAAATPAPPPSQPAPAAAEETATPSPTDPPPAETPPPPSPLVESAAPQPAVAPGVAPDATAPELTVTIARRPTLAQTLRRGLRSSVRCSEACTLRAQLVLPAREARRLRLGPGRRDVVVGGGRGGADGRAAASLVTRVTNRLARRLRGADTRRLILVVRAADAAGNARTIRRSVRVRRAR